MRKIKKILSSILVAAMAMSLIAGCGSSDASSSASGEASDTATAEQGAEGTFYIGAIGPTTGAAAIYGSAVMNGAQIAVDEINAAGGINGYQIAYKFEDDVHDAEKSVNAYNSLKDWGMQILMGTVTTNPCIAVGAETAADNMFELTPSASSTDVIALGDNIFQVCFTDPNQGVASADYMAETGLGSNIAVLYNSADVYSSGIYETFIEEAETLGLNVVYEGTFTDDTKTDFSTQLQAAQAAGADLLFLPFYYTEASIVFQQADAMGYDPIFFGVDGMDGILTLEGFDTSLAEGVYLLTPFAADAEDDATVNFVSAYEAAYGETPNQFAADAYDAIYIIKAAIEESGVTPDMSISDMCEALKSAMTQITVNGVTGEDMTWDASGAVSKGPRAVIIQDGVYVSAE